MFNKPIKELREVLGKETVIKKDIKKYVFYNDTFHGEIYEDSLISWLELHLTFQALDNIKIKLFFENFKKVCLFLKTIKNKYNLIKKVSMFSKEKLKGIIFHVTGARSNMLILEGRTSNNTIIVLKLYKSQILALCKKATVFTLPEDKEKVVALSEQLLKRSKKLTEIINIYLKERGVQNA